MCAFSLTTVLSVTEYAYSTEFETMSSSLVREEVKLAVIIVRLYEIEEVTAGECTIRGQHYRVLGSALFD